MSSRMMTFLLWTVGSMIATMVVMTLHTKTVTTNNSRVNDALEMAEKDLGLQDSTTEDLSMPVRAMRVAGAARRVSTELQRDMQRRIRELNEINSYGDVQVNPDSTNIHKLPVDR